MTGPRVLAIDQGTTNTKALLIDDQGRILAKASAPLTTQYPQAGWAEQSASDIWGSVRAVIGQVVDQAGPGAVDAIAIANQRETLVLWDSQTHQPICPAPIWQCRRTAPECAALIATGHDAEVIAATGLGINPLFEFRGGKVHRLRPALSPEAAIDRIVQEWRRSNSPDADLHVAALHAMAADAAHDLLARVEGEHAPATSFVGEFNAVMVAHVGPGLIGLAWWWDTASMAV